MKTTSIRSANYGKYLTNNSLCTIILGTAAYCTCADNAYQNVKYYIEKHDPEVRSMQVRFNDYNFVAAYAYIHDYEYYNHISK